MEDKLPQSERSRAIRALLCAHVEARLSSTLRKWDGRTDSVAKKEVEKAHEKYVLGRIIEKGVACSANISVATHIAKATHPDLKVKKVTNVNAQFGELYQSDLIGSHLLNDRENLADTTGDGAYNTSAYELYLLLTLRFEGRQLHEWLECKDEDAIAAISHGAESRSAAFDLAKKCVDLLADKSSIATDERMKQVYWCVGKAAEQDEDYLLLQPMFSSSLAQVVHQELEDARFGEQNKLARQARRENKAFDAGCRDYPDLAVRKLGGTKPQNISQLNSERRGENYLLSSLPPSWKQQPQRWLNIASVLPLFQRYEGVPALVKALLALLAPLDKKVKPVMETKIACEKIEQALGEALAAYGLSIRASQPPGWTRDASCRLELCEKLWLDPERASLPDRVEHEAEDQAFRQQLEWKDWPDQVAHRFGDWLNDILRDNKLPVGETEQAHWAKQAIVDAEWPTTMQRRALPPNRDKENGHA